MPKKISAPTEETSLTIVPRRPGRPTLYRPDMCDKVVQVAMQGGFHAAMMLTCGISETQFYEWIKTIPEFKEAVHYADLISLAQQEATLQKLATGEYRGNVNATLAILNNKWKTQYSRSASTESHEITINNNTINLTSEQVSQKIAEKLENFKRKGIEYIPTAPIVIENGEEDKNE